MERCENWESAALAAGQALADQAELIRRIVQLAEEVQSLRLALERRGIVSNDSNDCWCQK